LKNNQHQERDVSLDCEGCDGSGIRDPSTPSCSLHLPQGWHVLERCDTCQRFASDMAAARHRYGDHLWSAICDDGGWHIVVPDPARCGASGRPRVVRILSGIVGAVRRRLFLSSRFRSYLFNIWETFS
jgi:hypothetical protein